MTEVEGSDEGSSGPNLGDIFGSILGDDFDLGDLGDIFGSIFGSSNTQTEMTYSEGINTGYRWFDSMGIDPQYDFGYGLSYTDFEYSDMSVEENAEDGEVIGCDVTFTVKNVGDVAGDEVAEIYLGAAEVPDGIQMAKYQLAGYQRVKDLQPGESREVTVHVSERALSYWDATTEELNENGDKWTVAAGERTIYVGAAEDDLLLEQTVDVETEGKERQDVVKSSLEAMYEVWADADLSRYTAESAAVMESALANAKAVLEDADADDEDYQSAINTLIEALAGLKSGVQTIGLETALQAAYDILENADLYEDVSVLAASVEYGENVLNNPTASQADVDNAMYAILEELQKLVVRNVSSLAELVEAAQGLLDGSYTSDSLDALKDAIAAAEDVLANQSTDAEAVNEAYQNLINAILNLQMLGNKAALRAVLVRANAILADTSSYVPSTISNLASVTEAARAVYEDENAVQSEIDDAVVALTLEVAKARLLGDVDGDGTISTSDSTLLLQYAAEIETLQPDALASADVNGDGVADISDAVLILQYTAEKISAF